ncbi:MAG: prolipoprotein diacylglyceryl transferase [Epsilonproteobacteria bacterium]|nr:prolipoprotein diacylglyceryl transferase [Campylobacterota bacterium]
MCPRLFHIYGPVWVQSYGVMIAIGFLLFTWLTYRHQLRKHIIDGQLYINTLFVGLISGLLGGRITYALLYFDPTVDPWTDLLFPWEGGFVLHGGIIGILLATTTYLRYHKIPPLIIFDLAALNAPLMQSISRVGCFLAGCCYGIQAPEWLVWAVTFTSPYSPAPTGVLLHPTQLYFSLSSLLIFVGMHVILSTRSCKPGQGLFLYLMLETFARLTLDYWRGDRGELTTISLSQTFSLALSRTQILSLVLMLVAIIGFIIVTRSNNKTYNLCK